MKYQYILKFDYMNDTSRNDKELWFVTEDTMDENRHSMRTHAEEAEIWAWRTLEKYKGVSNARLIPVGQIKELKKTK